MEFILYSNLCVYLIITVFPLLQVRGLREVYKMLLYQNLMKHQQQLLKKNLMMLHKMVRDNRPLNTLIMRLSYTTLHTVSGQENKIPHTPNLKPTKVVMYCQSLLHVQQPKELYGTISITVLIASMHIVVNVMAKYSHVPMYQCTVYCIFVLSDKIHHTPGDWWMIHGPTDYIPRTEIGNTQRRLDCNTTYTHLSVDIQYLWAVATNRHCIRTTSLRYEYKQEQIRGVSTLGIRHTHTATTVLALCPNKIK